MPKPPSKPTKPYKYSHIAKAIAGPRATVDSGMLLADMIEVWGGTKQLALDLKGEFDRGSPGGMTRQRILEMIQRLIITNTTQDIGKSAEPSDLTDEELEGELLKFVKRLENDADPGPA